LSLGAIQARNLPVTTTYVSSGQTLSGATLSNPGDTIEVLNGGILLSAHVSAGGVLVESGGVTSGDVISGAQAYETVLGAGIAEALTVTGGGAATLDPAGVISGLTLASGAGFIDSGGALTGLTGAPGAHFLATPSSGQSFLVGQNDLTDNGGGAYTLAGVDPYSHETLPVITFALAAGLGAAEGFENPYLTFPFDGEIFIGSANAASGGVTSSGLTLASGNTLTVASGGSASAVTVGDGGAIYAFSGGTDAGATISPGGRVVVYSGATASGDTLLEHGEEMVSSGGESFGAVVTSFGVLAVESGGTVSGAVIQNGGVIEDLGGTIEGLVVTPGSTIALPSFSGGIAITVAGSALVVDVGSGQTLTIGLTSDPIGLTFYAAPAATLVPGSHETIQVGSAGQGIPSLDLPSDYNGDSLTDLTWRNTDGEAGLWLTTPGGGYAVVDFGAVDPNWVVQASADFNGDGKADILWRNTVTGQVGEWLSNPGSGFTGFTATIPAAVDSSWRIEGVGDFEGDGDDHADILWRNTNGDTGVWLTNPRGGYDIRDFGPVDPDWVIQAVADFTGTGEEGILWRNTVTGQVGEWNSKGGPGFSGFNHLIVASVDLSWQIQGVGYFTDDLNNGHLSDILWRNTNGDTGLWLSQAGGGFSMIDLGMVDLDWKIQGVGDFNGDGKADILWRNTVTGQVGEWVSNPGYGFTGFSDRILAAVDPSWRLQGVPPALQGGTSQSAALLAQAMAAMGSERSAHSPAVVTAPAASAPALLMAVSAAVSPSHLAGAS
jgi:autotransporter passenger strand-loop-strand repeat protein